MTMQKIENLRALLAERDALLLDREAGWGLYAKQVELAAERDTHRTALAESERKREALAVALDELVAEHDREHSERMDAEPGYGWPNETGGMVLARTALAANAGGAK